jgi:hypothetical protein
LKKKEPVRDAEPFGRVDDAFAPQEVDDDRPSRDLTDRHAEHADSGIHAVIPVAANVLVVSPA